MPFQFPHLLCLTFQVKVPPSFLVFTFLNFYLSNFTLPPFPQQYSPNFHLCFNSLSLLPSLSRLASFRTKLLWLASIYIKWVPAPHGTMVSSQIQVTSSRTILCSLHGSASSRVQNGSLVAQFISTEKGRCNALPRLLTAHTQVGSHTYASRCSITATHTGR